MTFIAFFTCIVIVYVCFGLHLITTFIKSIPKEDIKHIGKIDFELVSGVILFILLWPWAVKEFE